MKRFLTAFITFIYCNISYADMNCSMMSPKRRRELCMNDEMDPLVVVGLVIAVLAAIVIISKLPKKKSKKVITEPKKEIIE